MFFLKKIIHIYEVISIIHMLMKSNMSSSVYTTIF